MIHILESKVLNPYRSKVPRGFYNPIKKHTGSDLNYVREKLPCPITGKVVAVTSQPEMGNVLYIEDTLTKFIFVFAHMMTIDVRVGQLVKRNAVVGTTGNSGSKTTKPHLHFEIITGKPLNPIDWIMTRSLAGFKGYNTDPILFLKGRYKQFQLDNSGESKIPKPPTWLN